MKKILILMLTVLVSIQLYAATETKTEAKIKNDGYSMLDGVGRGFANILTGWIEVPRGITYYAVDYPVIGIVPGAFEGVGMTFIRAIGGVIDLLTVGYLEPGNTVYDTMDAPLYPWQSPWLPKKESLDSPNYGE